MSDSGDINKTHYRKAFDSPYLSAADIVEPIVLTIKRVVLERDRTKKTGDLFNTCYWREAEIRPGEKLKPMILNATNSKFLAQMTGSKFIDDWGGHAVTVWVDGNVRFGKETVEGLRLAAAAERPMTRADWLREAAESETLDVLGATSKAGAKYFNSMRDRDGYRAFAEAVQKRGAELRAQEGSAPDASADQGQANG
jgi:hypothetical protein